MATMPDTFTIPKQVTVSGETLYRAIRDVAEVREYVLNTFTDYTDTRLTEQLFGVVEALSQPLGGLYVVGGANDGELDAARRSVPTGVVWSRGRKAGRARVKRATRRGDDGLHARGGVAKRAYKRETRGGVQAPPPRQRLFASSSSPNSRCHVSQYTVRTGLAKHAEVA